MGVSLNGDGGWGSRARRGAPEQQEIQLGDSRWGDRQAVKEPEPKGRAATSGRIAVLIINIGHLLSSRLIGACQKVAVVVH